MNEDWVRMQSITNNPDHLSLFLSGGFYYLDDGKAGSFYPSNTGNSLSSSDWLKFYASVFDYVKKCRMSNLVIVLLLPIASLVLLPLPGRE